ncbi:iron donor protein CyaY [Pseudomonas sp. Choline-02u-1]|jgi:CyaY protein|uniref:iron donor protein CyaY n=1 Tax=unclassified Pseudomonas TaxID=196821 RepID=UPI000C330160|nr:MULTISPECIES: iron donor protein CyaY [unclassified Pseudomonas]PKH77960.1 iron donor protein CyaY [Pseudomonas sp. Choline-02u-1]
MSLSEARFHDLVDATQQALEELLEDHADDIEITAGMMTIKFDNGSQLIISRQEPLRQLWLAARSGGYHFDYDEESGKWSCEKSEELLGEVLSRCVHEQAGLELDFEEI